MDLWDEILSECEKIDFYFKKLNIIQQNIVNIDAIAEALNTTIDNILDTKTYVFPSLFRNSDQKGNEQEMVLFVNPYFINFYAKNVAIDDYIVTTCTMLFKFAFLLWKRNVLSISDIHLNLGAREIISKDVYLSGEGFGGYHAIDNNSLHNQFATHQFIDGNIRCVVKNFLSLVNVDIKKKKQLMWEHMISTDCIYKLSSEEDDDSFSSIFDKMIDTCQKYIDCICAK